MTLPAFLFSPFTIVYYTDSQNMRCGAKMDKLLMQPMWIIACAVLGLVIGWVAPGSERASTLVEPLLMVLLFFLFLMMDLRAFGKSLMNVRFTASAVLINFIITPLLSFILGLVFLCHSLDLRIGLVMLLVTPCTDWYLVFTRMSGGNVELGTSILPLNLILQIVLLPVYLMLFFGESSDMDPLMLLADMAVVLVVPFAVAMLARWAIRGRKHLQAFVSTCGDDIQLAVLCLAVIMMFASEGKSIVDDPSMIILLLIPLATFFLASYMIASRLGRMQEFPEQDVRSLVFTSMARNSPLALAVAVASFPDQPLIALALVIGPLIELPILSLTAWHLKHQDIGTRNESRISPP